MDHRTPLALLGLLAITIVSRTEAQTPLTTVRVANGLAQPLFASSPVGDYDRLFIVEQSTGLIRILKNGTILATPFLNVRSRISVGGERGLLGLAFHPNYAQNGYFYVDYTRAGDGGKIIERFTVSTFNPDVADFSTGTIILGPIPHPLSNHNGGCLQFGPDGYLYASEGDGGSSGDPSCNAQNGNSLLGKILRIDVDGGSPYAIPPTNPFVNDPNFRDEIWTYGWRNPWRFSFDRANGDMYVGDVGQNTREEVSFTSGTSPGGENYGWKIMEGNNCFSTAACNNPPPCNSPLLTRPIYDYANAGAECSVTGGYVYRGCAIPDLQGTYFFADYCSARIWSFRYDGTTVSQFTDRTAELVPNIGTIASITSFGEDGRGELHIIDGNGEVFKIVARGPAAAEDLGFGKVGSNGKQPRFEVCGQLGAGSSAQFILRDAPASAPAALLLSDTSSPTTFPFGTVVPIPPLITAAFTTDGQGVVQFTVPGGLGPAVVYGQWGMLDVGTSGGIGLSNALKITFP